jgi:hypothetical protein
VKDRQQGVVRLAAGGWRPATGGAWNQPPQRPAQRSRSPASPAAGTRPDLRPAAVVVASAAAAVSARRQSRPAPLAGAAATGRVMRRRATIRRWPGGGGQEECSQRPPGGSPTHPSGLASAPARSLLLLSRRVLCSCLGLTRPAGRGTPHSPGLRLLALYGALHLGRTGSWGWRARLVWVQVQTARNS